MGAGVYADGDALFELRIAIAAHEDGSAPEGEYGGLLLGASGPEMSIEGIRPLPIEYRFGPSFWLSSADIGMVEREIARAAESQRGKPIGHFRTQRKGESEPADVDHAIADLLPISEPLLLLILTAERGPKKALIYRRKKGIWVRVLCTLLDAIPPMVPRRIPAAPIALVPSRPQAPSLRVWPARAAGAALVFVAVGALLSGMLFRWGSAPPPRTPPAAPIGIGLQALTSAGTVTVRWNRSSPVVLQGNSATLIIQDGDSKQELALSREHLQSGSVAYTPVTGKVDLRLEVYANPGRYSGESVSVATGVVPPIPKTESDSIRLDATSRPASANSRRSIRWRLRYKRPANRGQRETAARGSAIIGSWWW